MKKTASESPNPWYKVVAADYYGAFEVPIRGTLSSYAPNTPNDQRLEIKQNMAIEVLWPGGEHYTVEKLRIEDGHDSAQIDMNCTPDQFQTRMLYVEINYHGVKAKVPLKNLKIRPA